MRGRAGFSLIELMVVVTIAGLLIGITAGPIGRQIARDRVLRSANVVQGMVTEASQLAVRRREPVRISLNGTVLQITNRAGTTVIKRRNFGPDSDLRATLAVSPDTGITIFPSGRADHPLTVTVSGTDISSTVTRTATGIVRRQ